MKTSVGALVLAIIGCGCPAKRAVEPTAPTGVPTCEGAPIAWDDAARAEASRLITQSLAESSTENPLGVVDAARDLHAEGRTYFVVVPDGVTVPDLPGLRRVESRPPPSAAEPDVPVWSDEIVIVDRYRDGYMFRTEEDSAFFNGPTARLVNLQCGRFVEGKAVVIHLRGVAS